MTDWTHNHEALTQPTTRSVFNYLNRRRQTLYLSRPVLGESAKAFTEYWAVVQALDIVGDILDRESEAKWSRFFDTQNTQEEL
jgi:hypothetical protein